jgi:FkbM family methyltransferase
MRTTNNLIVSQMRSFSTLFAHQLATRTGDFYVGETHSLWRSRQEFKGDHQKLARKWNLAGRTGAARLDKLSLCAKNNGRDACEKADMVHFIARDPVTSLASLIKTEWFTPREALRYLRQSYNRIDNLARMRHLLGKPYQFVEGYEVVSPEGREKVFGDSDPSYDVLPITGQVYLGDPYGNITKGITEDRDREADVERCYKALYESHPGLLCTNLFRSTFAAYARMMDRFDKPVPTTLSNVLFPRYADGLYLDMGYHRGEGHARLVGLGVIPQSYIVVGYEPNPFIEGQPPHVKQAAIVADDRESITFYPQRSRAEGKLTEVGSTTIEKFADGLGRHTFGKLEKVPALRASEEIKSYVQDLRPSRVILKMDIEGQEYEVLRDLFDSNVIHCVDELHVEWHDWVEGFDYTREDTLELEALLKKAGVKVSLNP